MKSRFRDLKEVFEQYDKLLISIFLLVCYLIFIPVEVLWNIKVYDAFDIYLRIGLIFLILIFWSKNFIQSKKITPFVLGIAVFSCTIVINTFLFQGDMKQALWSNAIIPVAIVLGIELVTKKYSEQLIRVGFWLYLIYGVLNLLMVWYVDRDFFFGNRNCHIYYYFILLFCGFYGYHKGYIKKTFLVIAYLVCAATVYKAGGVAVSGILLLGLLFCLFFNWKFLHKLCTPWCAMAANLIVFIILQLQALTNVFERFFVFISSLLHRASNVSNRAPIWIQTWEQIVKKPVFGYGYRDMLEAINTAHPHSIYLHILLNRGIVGFAVFIGILIILALTIQKIADKKLRSFFSFFLFCVLLAGQVDEYVITYYFLYGGLLYYLSRIEIEKQNG